MRLLLLYNKLQNNSCTQKQTCVSAGLPAYKYLFFVTCHLHRQVYLPYTMVLSDLPDCCRHLYFRCRRRYFRQYYLLYFRHLLRLYCQCSHLSYRRYCHRLYLLYLRQLHPQHFHQLYYRCRFVVSPGVVLSVAAPVFPPVVPAFPPASPVFPPVVSVVFVFPDGVVVPVVL